MIDNPYKERYRKWIDGSGEDPGLTIDLYYDLSEALGRIQELEETLSGLLDRVADRIIKARE